MVDRMSLGLRDRLETRIAMPHLFQPEQLSGPGRPHPL